MKRSNHKGKENWKLWDAVFSLGILSFLKDGEEAQNDDNKFKQYCSKYCLVLF